MPNTMTPDEQRAMRGLSVARIRRNYWLCDAQIKMAEGKPHLAEAAAKLQTWQSSYLDELVRRGERV